MTNETPAIHPSQLSLFGQFVANDGDQPSNMIGTWDSVPKYFFTPQQVEKLRTPDGLAQTHSSEFMRHGARYEVVIQPALITIEGADKAFFPSVTEELVEEALRRMLARDMAGEHDSTKVATWVSFSLKGIMKELGACGRARNFSQIKHAIQVMSGCVITLRKDSKAIWKGPILSDLITVSRDDYIEDTDTHHRARLPVFVSLAISQMNYRQINYERLMSCDDQLTRWLYKKFVDRFRNASMTITYHFKFSDVQRDSQLLNQARPNDNRRRMTAALEELKAKKVILSYELVQATSGRKVLDVTYTVTPTIAFVSEQKAANKRGSTLATDADSGFTLPNNLKTD